MKYIFKWKYEPSGVCPVQAEGWFLGKYFYFRSRWSTSTIEFAKSELDWMNDNILRHYDLKTTAPYEAGWLSQRKCKMLIYLGCLLFLLKIKSKYVLRKIPNPFRD